MDHTSDTPYIVTGFRPQMSLYQCVASIFYWHNQTINIWSSLLLIGFNIWNLKLTLNMPYDFMLVFWFHGVCRSVCWCNSCIYHTFVCSSKQNARILCRLDYIGCYLTPIGMGTNILFLELYFHQNIAMFLVTEFGCALGSMFASMLPEYQTESYRGTRFILSLISIFPYVAGLAVSICTVHTFTIPSYYMYLVAAFAWEILGAFFYTSMLPERWYPVYFISSHNLWHLCNFGFDYFMMQFAYSSFNMLHQKLT